MTRFASLKVNKINVDASPGKCKAEANGKVSNLPLIVFLIGLEMANKNSDFRTIISES